jgi:hypothetical protein
VTHPDWSCGEILKFKSITSKQIEITEVLKDQGPFNCVAKETIVLQKTSKTSASVAGVFDCSDARQALSPRAKKRRPDAGAGVRTAALAASFDQLEANRDGQDHHHDEDADDREDAILTDSPPFLATH